MHPSPLLIYIFAWDVGSIAVSFLDDQAAGPSLFISEDITPAEVVATYDNLCAIQEGSNPTNELDLFARGASDAAECLPPVNIGPESLQLFEDPLTMLQKLPLQTDDDPAGSGPSSPQSPEPKNPIYPGLLPKEQNGLPALDYDEFLETMGKQGWVDLQDPAVEGNEDDDDACDPGLLEGIYEYNLCCEGPAVERNRFADPPDDDMLAQLDQYNRLLTQFDRPEPPNHHPSGTWKYEAVAACFPSMCISMSGRTTSRIWAWISNLKFSSSTAVGLTCPQEYHVCCQEYVSWTQTLLLASRGSTPLLLPF